MATVNEGFIEVEEKDFSSLAHLYPTRVKRTKRRILVSLTFILGG